MIERGPEGEIVSPIDTDVVPITFYSNIKLVGINHTAGFVHLLLIVVDLLLSSFSCCRIWVHGVVQIFPKRRQR